MGNVRIIHELIFNDDDGNEINIDEILIDNFIHDSSGRNYTYLLTIDHLQYTAY